MQPTTEVPLASAQPTDSQVSERSQKRSWDSLSGGEKPANALQGTLTSPLGRWQAGLRLSVRQKEPQVP